MNIQAATKTSSRARVNPRKGAEMIEFTLVLLPMLCMILVLLDISWAVFVKSTLQSAVSKGLRAGITTTGTQAAAAGSCITEIVKSTVQASSLGMLQGSVGLSKIKVNYYLPAGTGAPTDVSGQVDGNKPLNIMQVSIQGYNLAALTPRIWSWRQAADVAPSAIYAAAADLIEASRDVPCIGIAP